MRQARDEYCVHWHWLGLGTYLGRYLKSTLCIFGCGNLRKVVPVVPVVPAVRCPLAAHSLLAARCPLSAVSGMPSTGGFASR